MSQRLAARGQDHQIGASGQQLGDQGDDGVEDVLAVVEDEQEVPAGELVDERRGPGSVALEGEVEGRADLRGDAVTWATPANSTSHTPSAPAEARHLPVGDLQGQAGLARSSRAGEREEARPFEQPTQLGQFPVATDEARRQGGEVVRTRPGIGGGTDEQPAVDGGGLGGGVDAVRLREAVAQPLEGSGGVPASADGGQRHHERLVDVLVEWPLHRQRLEQRDGLFGLFAGQQGPGQSHGKSGPRRVQPVAVRRRPVLVEVLGQQFTRPQGERAAQVVEGAGRGCPRRGDVEVVDVDGHAALAAERDDLPPEKKVLGPHHPAGGVQRLMEVVGADGRVDVGPQLLGQDIAVHAVVRLQSQELDDRPGLSQAPRGLHRGAVDAHGETTQEGDPHGPGNLAHHDMFALAVCSGDPVEATRSRRRVERPVEATGQSDRSRRPQPLSPGHHLQADTVWSQAQFFSLPSRVMTFPWLTKVCLAASQRWKRPPCTM